MCVCACVKSVGDVHKKNICLHNAAETTTLFAFVRQSEINLYARNNSYKYSDSHEVSRDSVAQAAINSVRYL